MLFWVIAVLSLAGAFAIVWGLTFWFADGSSS